MLHWLAGQKPPEDPDATNFIEPPETPAPVFAVRAFKHAIFGTPQTTQPKPRRNSSTDSGRTRNGDVKPARPGMTRPKSASDAAALGKHDAQALLEPPLASPTKGILLTPGTAAAKKKNVTFGDHVLDNEEKRPLRSGLPEDCPGKFPSTEIKHADDVYKEEPVEKGRGRSKLTEALEQARDESRKRKSKADKRGRNDVDEDNAVPTEFVDPKSDSGKYWKHEYDIYRTNTQREVKKLITKQKAAKSFAQQKDMQCTELADELRQERKKVDDLEAKMAEFTTLMKDLHEQLKGSQDAERKQRDEIAMLKPQLVRKDSARPTSSEGAGMAPLERNRSNELQSEEFSETNKEPIQRPSEPCKPSAEPEKPKTDLQTFLDRRARAKQKSVQSKPDDDIWAQSFGSSSLVETRTVGKPPPSPRGGRTVTSGTDATPLKTLDVNARSNGRDPRPDSSPRSLDVECKSTPEIERVSEKTQVQVRQETDEPLLPTGPPAFSPEAQTVDSSVVAQMATHRKPFEDLSIQLPSSSPFQPQAKALPTRSVAAPAGPREAPGTTKLATQATNTKENVSPTSKTDLPQNKLRLKPSQMWTSINAPQANSSKPGNTSVMAKDGRQVSQDRIEAARARINARGRVTS